jgi:hypothetical protein
MMATTNTLRSVITVGCVIRFDAAFVFFGTASTGDQRNVRKMLVMVIMQHLLRAIDSPTFDDSNPICKVEEYARRRRWTRPDDIRLWNWKQLMSWHNILHCHAGSWHCASFESRDIGRI